MQSQISTTAENDVTAINNFKTSSLVSLQRSFNTLRDDVYGHFFRSQNTLRLAREDLNSNGAKFAYYRLTSDTRQKLAAWLKNVVQTCIDPTIQYLQINAMDRYYNVYSEPMTPIEQTFQPVVSQLSELITAVQAATDSACLNKENINGQKLSNAYNPMINAIDGCTRNASSQYRAPINEFTRIHFVALPFIARMSLQLQLCNSVLSGNDASREVCVLNFVSEGLKLIF